MGRGHYGIFVTGASGRPKLMSSAIPNRQLVKGLGMVSGMTKEEPVPHFFLLAYDGTDADAPARRKSARGAHFEGIKPMVERGELRAAGAILNDSGEMIGSAIFADFPSRAALDAWLDREPY